MSEMPQAQFNDEIDLLELIRQIWDGKWLVMAVALLVVFLGYGFLFLFKDNKNIAIAVEPLGRAEGEVYSTYNSALSYINDNKQTKLNKSLVISPGPLASAFSDEILKKETLAQALIQAGDIDRQAGETDQEFSARLNQRILGFKFIKPELDDEDLAQDLFRIEFGMKGDVEQIQAFIDLWFSLTADNIKSFLVRQHENYIEAYQQLNRWEMDDLEKEKSDLLINYELEKNQKIEYLREQAEIARSLGIKENALATKMSQNQDLFSLVLDNRQLFYMRGYEAIEREINLIENRKDITQHVPAFVKIENRLRDLKQDITLGRLNTIFLKTPVMDGEFSAISTSKTQIEFTPKYNPLLFIILFVILGGVFGLIALVFKNAIMRQAPQA